MDDKMQDRDFEQLTKELLRDKVVKQLVDKKTSLKYFLIGVGAVCVVLIVVCLLMTHQMGTYETQQKLQYQVLHNLNKSAFQKTRKEYATAAFTKCALKLYKKWNDRELAELADLIYERGECGYGITMEEWIILVRLESQFDYTQISSAGAVGLFQIMPLTAAYVAPLVGISYTGPAMLKTPRVSAILGMRFYYDLKTEYKNPVHYITAYCWGPRKAGEWRGGRSMSRDERKYIQDWAKAKAWAEETLDTEINIEGIVVNDKGEVQM